MAIYKPSNCTPFLETYDLTQSHDISCELNTSNEEVTGYKLKLYDSKNNILFEGDKITKSDDASLWLNGSNLILPFIVIVTDLSSLSNYNVIYYNSQDQKWYKKIESGSTEINNIKNGSVNQPYKWEITLYQGDISDGTQKPASLKYYDMTISSGRVLGSTATRIQGYLSENIYQDYYIQLYDNTFSTIGKRVRISSYDHSYGYLYPQEGYLDNTIVSNSSYFKVFKDTNDPQAVSKARLVTYISFIDISQIKYGDNVSANLVLNTTTNYLSQTYEGVEITELSLDKYVKGGTAGAIINSGMTILFTGYGNGNTTVSGTGEATIGNATYNAFNGVLSLVGIEYKDGNTTITWMRPSNFNKYANFVDQLICVSEGASGDKNYSCSANGLNVGTINETGLMFFDEEPVGLYPEYSLTSTIENKELLAISDVQRTIAISGNKGSGVFSFDGHNILNLSGITVSPNTAKATITLLGGSHYKIDVTTTGSETSVDVTGTFNCMQDYSPVLKNEKTKTYIAPFVGLLKDMKFFYGDELTNNLDITYIDNKATLVNKFSPVWYIEHSSLDNPLIANDEYQSGTQYAIKSFFKISDENPFYVYDKPTIQLNLNPIDSTDNNKVTNRYVTASGEYSQVQNKSWKNFQFILTDYNYPNNPRSTGKIYNGEMSYKFYGLENGHSYEIVLIIEDELGNTEYVSKEFYVGAEISATEIPFSSIYNCDTYSVDLQLDNNAKVIPTENRNYKFKDGGLQLANGEYIEYQKIELGGQEYNIPSIIKDDGTTTFNSNHIFSEGYFEGDIIEYNENDGSLNNANSFKLTLKLPSVTVNGGMAANSVRNTIYYNINGTDTSLNELYINGATEPESSGTWQDLKPVVSPWKPADADIDDKKYDYIDTTSFYLKDQEDASSYLNIKGSQPNLNSEIKMPWACSGDVGGNNGFTYWSDEEITVKTGKDDKEINVFTGEKNRWSDTGSSDEDHYWQDNPNSNNPSIYINKDKEKEYTGRQFLESINFNVKYTNGSINVVKAKVQVKDRGGNQNE